jgi:hypothetical protein
MKLCEKLHFSLTVTKFDFFLSKLKKKNRNSFRICSICRLNFCEAEVNTIKLFCVGSKLERLSRANILTFYKGQAKPLNVGHWPTNIRRG